MQIPTETDKQPMGENDGCVIQILAGSTFRVRLDDGTEVHARLSGRIRRIYQCILIHGRVRIALDEDNPRQGIIIKCYDQDNCD